MKKLLVILVLIASVAWPAVAARPDDCSIDVLPDGPKQCVYRHVDYASFSYDGERLAVRWPDHLVVEDVHLARDWKKMFAYRPGSGVRVELSAKSRYDLVARFTDSRSGETVLGITPVSCVSRLGDAGGIVLTPAPGSGCVDLTTAASCEVKTTVDCTDDEGNVTGTATVECNGDNGTCSDACSDSQTACCQATRTTTQTSTNGTETSVTSIEQTQMDCD